MSSKSILEQCVDTGSALTADIHAHLCQVTMINRILAVMWPHVTTAVMKDVLKQVGPILEKQVFAKVGGSCHAMMEINYGHEKCRSISCN